VINFNLSISNFDDKIRKIIMKKRLSLLYEKFYKGIKLQKRIIERKNFTYRLILDFLEPYLIDRKRILDIGCGVGTLSFYIASRGNDVKGIDISHGAIAACKLNAKGLGLEKNVNFQAVDFLKTEINGGFDLILCSEVLEHLINEQLAIKKIFGNLRNGGILMVSVPSRNAPLFRLGFMKKFDKKVGHLRRYDVSQLLDLFKKNNFEILEVKGTEGIFRNFLFYNWLGALPLRFANRFAIISDIFTFFDNITLRLFGESQIIVVAQKPGKEEK